MTPPNNGRRSTTSPLLCLLVASIQHDLCHSLAPPSRNALHFRGSSSSQSSSPQTSARHLRPQGSHWEDDTRSSRHDSTVGDFKPPWRDHDANGNPNKSNASKDVFQQTPTDDFKRPHGSGPVNNAAQRQADNTYRHQFQTTSTDDFKRPHGMPPNMNQQQAPPPRTGGYKSPFQTSSTASFKQSRDEGTGADAPQQDMFDRSDRRNSVGQDAYDSTRTPPRSPGAPGRNAPPKRFTDAEIIDEAELLISQQQNNGLPPGVSPLLPVQDVPTIYPPQQQQQQAAPPRTRPAPPEPERDAEQPPSWFGRTSQREEQATAQPASTQPPPGVQTRGTEQHAQVPFTPPVARNVGGPPPVVHQHVVHQHPPAATTPEQHLEQWDQKLETAQTRSNRMLLRNIQWPLGRDPSGASPDFPLLATRVIVTVLATVSTRHLHLVNGYSPILASSAMTLFVSTCVDRRLGQAALCGSFAGMSGGHLVPNISMAMLLGAVTSLAYEFLIRINNVCSGIGGRLGATAFLATSILAKYQKVGSVGRKMRRGLWRGGPSSIAVTMVLFHMLGSVATIFLREASDDSGAADPVRASSVVGLLGSLFVTDPMAALAIYGGSFVGMSLPSRLMHGNAPGNAKLGQPRGPLSLVMSFAGAGAIAGLIHAATIHNGYWNGGWGGKASLCAFAGCWVFRGFGNLSQFLNNRT